MRTAHLQFAHRHQRLELERQVLLAFFLEEPEALEVRLAEPEGPGRHILTHQRPAQAVIPIDHHLTRATEDAVLGLVISRQPTVAVHVVFADVQAGGHFGIELLGGFQLEAGKLQYVEIDFIGKQIERWRAQIAADRHGTPGCRGHLADQSGHSALGVGAGDRDDGCLGFAGEQLDVPRQLDAPCRGFLQRRRADRKPGAHQQLAGGTEEIHIQFAAAYLHIRVLGLQRGQFRRVRTSVHHGKRQPAARQVANQGHAALAEADNDAELVGSDEHS